MGEVRGEVRKRDKVNSDEIKLVISRKILFQIRV